MRRTSVCIAVFLSVACTSENEHEPEQWKAAYTDEQCRTLMTTEAIIQRCGSGDLDRALEKLNEDPVSCIPYSSTRVMSGVWVSGFEFSAFYEGASDYAEVVAREGDVLDGETWFSPVGKADEALRKLPSIADGLAFKVEVIGRKSLCEGEYGHGGNSSEEVLANHFLSIKPVHALNQTVR